MTKNDHRELARLGLPITVDAFVAIAEALDARNPGCTIRYYNGSLIIDAHELPPISETVIIDTSDPTLALGADGA